MTRLWNASLTADSKRAKQEFVWRGPYPHLYRIRYPDGWMSTSANLARAKDVAYGHARYLLGTLRRVEACYSPEGEVAVA
jgi:hypothetical protein